MLKVRAGIQAGALGIADQVLLSLTNLIIGLALAREMDPNSFGIYVIIFALFLIGTSVQVSLITDPLVVLGSPREGRAQAGYFNAVWRLQWWLSGALTLLAGTAALIATGVSPVGSELPGALAGLALATAPLQAQMFLRALLFARFKPGKVLLIDGIFVILRLVLVILLVVNDQLSTFSIMVTAGIAALLSTLTGIHFCRAVLSHTDATPSVWKEHWRFGRWLLATSGAYWCSGQTPALVASAMIAPAAAAVIKACQYLVAPLSVAFTGLDGILAPRAARINSIRGYEAGRFFLALVAGGCVLTVLIYSALLLPVAESLLDWLYRGQYAGHLNLVVVLLMDALLAAVARAPALGLKVRGHTRALFMAYLAGSIAGLAALAWLLPSFGVLGVAIAAPLSTGVTLAVLLPMWLTSSSRLVSAGAQLTTINS
jgi:O-antigen/teichoic acid export membrane protein